MDSTNYKVSESNKALFVRATNYLGSFYAVKLRLSKEHRSELNMENFYDKWLDKLIQYIYYSTKYVENKFDNALNNQNTTEDVLKLFKEQHPELHWKYADVISVNRIKKLHLHGKTMLVHVFLYQDMKPVLPGSWDKLIVEFMKSVYYCPGFGEIDSAPMGEFLSCNCQ